MLNFSRLNLTCFSVAELLVSAAIFLNDASSFRLFMHEWALAEAVIAAASQIAKKEEL